MPRWVFNVLTYAPAIIYILVLFVLFVLGKVDNDYEYGYKELTKEQKKTILKQNLIFVFLIVYYVIMSVVEYFIYDH
jgi:hypothetical protein